MNKEKLKEKFIKLREKSVFVDIPGFNGDYKINRYGDIINKFGYSITPRKNNRGYLLVHLVGRIGHYKNNSSTYLVHRLVGQTFIKNSNPKEYNQIDHLNGIKDDNYYKNLEWVNNSINNKRAYKMGLKKMVISKEQAKKHSEFMKKMYTEGKLDNNLTYNHDPKTIYQFDMEGNLVGTYLGGKEASEKTGVGKSNIYECLREDNGRYIAGNFFWSYDKGFVPDKSFRQTRDFGEVLAISLFTPEILGRFESATEAKRILKVDKTSVLDAIDNPRKKGSGYRWASSLNYKPELYEKPIKGTVIAEDINDGKTYYFANKTEFLKNCGLEIPKEKIKGKTSSVKPEKIFGNFKVKELIKD